MIGNRKAGDMAYRNRRSPTPGRMPMLTLALLVLPLLTVPGIGSAHAKTGTANTNPQADSEDAEPCSGDQPEPTAVTVDAVPIVVASTTSDYFVLYVRHQTDAATIEIPVAVVLGQAGTTTLAENVQALPAESYRVEKYQVSDPADVDGDCVDDITELRDPVAKNPVNPASSIAPAHGTVSVPDQGTFETLGVMLRPEGHGKAGTRSHRSVKILVSDMDDDLPVRYYINVNTHRFHEDFLEATGLEIDSPNAPNLTIAYSEDLIAPDGSEGAYYYVYDDIFQFQFFDNISRVHAMLAADVPLLDDNLLLYVPNYMLTGLQTVLPRLRESRIPLVFDDDVFGVAGSTALNPGVGYGRLRKLDADERPHPRDIVIYEALPNELPPVAGIISTVAQTPLSHVNLRAVQNGVPNAYIRDLLDDSDVGDLIGEYVRFEVSDAVHSSDRYSIRAATPAEVEAHYESSRPYFTQIPRRDLSVTAITPLSSIGFDDWDVFGVKAANLAVLRTMGLPAGTVPDGFAVPFYFYDEFMKANDLYADIREMLADEDFRTDFDVQADKLKKLRKKIKKADTPQWIIDALTAMHATFPEGQSLRYRSSTNNEDLPGFNGAGLYDSKTQKPDETVEDGISKSLKQVYASLWNFRAFSEREFHRVDHLASAMGVLVHPNYSDEKVNGVAVSFDPTNTRRGSYYVNSQLGEDLVTNPEAYSVPEEILLREDGKSILALSNLVEAGRLLMSTDQMDQLRRHLRTVHDGFKRLYQPAAGERFAMEIEFKITSDNVLAIKQARPWVFPGAIERAPRQRPADLSARATDHSVRVVWTLPEQIGRTFVDWMYLERLDSGDSVAWSTQVGGAAPEPGRSYHGTVRGLSAATGYRFRVRLLMDTGAEVYSEVVAATTETGASKGAAGLSAVATHDSVSVSFTIPEQPGWVTDATHQASVRVVRQATAPLWGEPEDAGSATWQRATTAYSYTDTAGVYPGQSYRYRVETLLGDRLHLSDWVPVTALAQPTDSDGDRGGAAVLDAAAAARAVVYTHDHSLHGNGGDTVDYYTFTTTAPHTLGLGVRGQSIDLDVTLEDADGNIVARSWPPPGNPGIEWLKTVIEPGTYYIRVEAGEDALTGYYIRFGLSSPPATPPAGPTGLKAAAAADSATLSWTVPAQPQGVTVRGVYVERGGADGSFDLATQATGPDSGAWSWTDTGVESGEQYSYRVRLSTTAGEAHTGTVTVTVAQAETLSSNVTLSALTLGGVDFGAFSSGTLSYTADVANDVAQTTVAATVGDDGASYIVKVGGVTDADGTVDLAVGANVVTVEVTAEDGTTGTYTVTVTRAEAPLSSDASLSGLSLGGVDFGAFSSGTLSYTADVANDVTQTTVAATVGDDGASYIVKVGGVTDADGTVALAVGANVVTVEVTAEDGTTGTYTVTVTRAEAPAPDTCPSDAELLGRIETADRVVVNLTWLIDNQAQVWSGDSAVIPVSAPLALYHQDGTRIPTTEIESITLSANPGGHREWLDDADGFSFANEYIIGVTFKGGCSYDIG